MSLHWQSSAMGKEYRILRGRVIAGILKINLWKGDAYGELDGHLLRFKNSGFWKPETKILDIEGVRELGSITYNYWKSTATISYEGADYIWTYTSWWKGKWILQRDQDRIDFATTGFWKSEGIVENDVFPAALTLAGLFVYSHFLRITSTGTS